MAYIAHTHALPGDQLASSLMHGWRNAAHRLAAWVERSGRPPEPTLFQRCLAVHIAAATETRWRSVDPPEED